MPKFSSENLGTWFYFDSTNETAGGVCLRLPTEEEYRHIDRLTLLSSKKKAIKGILYDDIKRNEVLETKLRWRVMIADWKEVYLDGQLLDCTDENKDKMRKVNAFKLFVGDKIDKLIDTDEALKEALAKNSGSSSNGNAENQIVETA